MTTTALLTAARALATKGLPHEGDTLAFVDSARTLLPQLADALVALHANVRNWAIPIEGHCHLCDSDWTRPSPRLGPMAIAAVLVYGPETHAPSCPARPMEG